MGAFQACEADPNCAFDAVVRGVPIGPEYDKLKARCARFRAEAPTLALADVIREGPALIGELDRTILEEEMKIGREFCDKVEDPVCAGYRALRRAARGVAEDVIARLGSDTAARASLAAQAPTLVRLEARYQHAAAAARRWWDEYRRGEHTGEDARLVHAEWRRLHQGAVLPLDYLKDNLPPEPSPPYAYVVALRLLARILWNDLFAFFDHIRGFGVAQSHPESPPHRRPRLVGQPRIEAGRRPPTWHRPELERYPESVRWPSDPGAPVVAPATPPPGFDEGDGWVRSAHRWIVLRVRTQGDLAAVWPGVWQWAHLVGPDGRRIGDLPPDDDGTRAVAQRRILRTLNHWRRANGLIALTVPE